MRNRAVYELLYFTISILSACRQFATCIGYLVSDMSGRMSGRMSARTLLRLISLLTIALTAATCEISGRTLLPLIGGALPYSAQ